jgi:hypothetical protein
VDLAVVDDAFRERTAVVRARRGNGTDVLAVPHEQDGLIVDVTDERRVADAACVDPGAEVRSRDFCLRSHDGLFD